MESCPQGLNNPGGGGGGTRYHMVSCPPKTRYHMVSCPQGQDTGVGGGGGRADKINWDTGTNQIGCTN